MNNQEIFSHVDHTLLKPFAKWEEIEALCNEAVEYRTACVCVPPCYVKRIESAYEKKLNICTVIGFPLGYSVTSAKIEEAKRAVNDGASEIDMVINISDVKNGLFEDVMMEIRQLKEAVGDNILKVIVETCYLTEYEKIRLCEIVTHAGADYIKTSTGFGTAGATISDIELFKAHIGTQVRIKAAGGIRTKSDLIKFLEAGCDRIGTSSAVSLLGNA